MKINNIIFDISSKIDNKHNKLVIPFILFDKHVEKNKLLNYLGNFVTIERNNMNVKIINDIEEKISNIVKPLVNLSIVIQNKVNYFKIIIMVMKFKKKEFSEKKLDLLINVNSTQSKQKLGEFYEHFRVLGSTCIMNLTKSEIYKSNICLPNFKELKIKVNLKTESRANLAFIEGMILTMYKFKKYKSIQDNKYKTYLLNYVSKNKYIEYKLNKLFNTTKTFFFVKDIINEPSNTLSPVSFIEKVKRYIKIHNLPLSVIVLDKKKLLKLGMNLIVSVGDGSSKENQSKLMVLVY